MLGNNSAEPAKERFLGQHQAGESCGMRALSSLRYGLIYRTEAGSAGSATHLPRATVESQAGIGRYTFDMECGLVGLRKPPFSYMPGTLFSFVVGMNTRGVRP